MRYPALLFALTRYKALFGTLISVDCSVLISYCIESFALEGAFACSVKLLACA
ncbi:hypothetical protein ACBE110449_22055 [Acinetobacter bereziniae]